MCECRIDDEKCCCYFVDSQSIGDVLCSFWSDFIAIEVKCGECLCEMYVNVEQMMKSVVVTLLICRVLATCCAPSGPI